MTYNNHYLDLADGIAGGFPKYEDQDWWRIDNPMPDMNLFQSGQYYSHSGLYLPGKIECDALTDGDIECCAKWISDAVGPFRDVEGVPSGGLRLAEVLTGYSTELDYHPILIVDDVLTTGASMEKYFLSLSPDKIEAGVKGFVLFDRSAFRPYWIQALFQAHPVICGQRA